MQNPHNKAIKKDVSHIKQKELKSLSIGILITSIICFFFGYVALKIKHTGLRIIFILLTPLFLSQLIYWFLVNNKTTNNGAIDNWSGMIAPVWAIAGLVSILIALFIFSRSSEPRDKNG